MITRQDIEQRERELLSPYAAKAADSSGRDRDEPKCPYRTDFQRDRDRIVHSKAFRRLMHKTQVFLAPEGDHYRTRLTHTIEVSQIARTIARALALNEDLTEAIAMGHDLGHTPFGHNGEDALAERHPGGFRHNEQSLRVVEVLERSNDGQPGMNLTPEVRDGILNHSGDQQPKTLEGQVVHFSDRIAYINHDIDDALRSGVLADEDLPADCVATLGRSHRARINTLVGDLVVHSQNRPEIRLSLEKQSALDDLRAFMFKEVYQNQVVKHDEEMDKIKAMIFALYDTYEREPERLPAESQVLIAKWGLPEIIKDHIASMTDRYAVKQFSELFIPKSWKPGI